MDEGIKLVRSLRGVNCYCHDGTYVYSRGQTETTIPYHARSHPRLAK